MGDVPSESFESGDVRAGEHRDDAHGGMHGGVWRGTEHGREDAALLDLAQQLLRGLAADGVCDGIQQPDAGEGLLVVKRDEDVRAERLRFVELTFLDARDDGGTGLFGDIDRSATDAADGAGDEYGPAFLGGDAFVDQLIACEKHERQGGGVDDAEVFRDAGELFGLDDDELGVGLLRKSEDTIPLGEGGDALAGCGYGA